MEGRSVERDLKSGPSQDHHKFCLIWHSGIWENFKCENLMMEAN